jgi:hypothetical protein
MDRQSCIYYSRGSQIYTKGSHSEKYRSDMDIDKLYRSTSQFILSMENKLLDRK